jgi:hypothetical protein
MWLALRMCRGTTNTLCLAYVFITRCVTKQRGISLCPPKFKDNFIQSYENYDQAQLYQNFILPASLYFCEEENNFIPSSQEQISIFLFK